MTEHPGVPASERVELTGLKYQSARARDGLHEAVTRLSSAAASRPALPELARRRALQAGQRALRRALDAVPPAAKAAAESPFPAGTRARAALAPAALALVLAVAAAIVLTRLRHNH